MIKAEFLRYKPGRKVLFGGHSGNGKSTELNKFIFDPEIRGRFEIIKIDVLDSLEAVILAGKSISEKDVENAVKEFRISMSRPLRRSQKEILIEIDSNKKFSGDLDEKRLELLQGLYILEYINDEVWYSVNPILESLLEERKQIIAANPR